MQAGMLSPWASYQIRKITVCACARNAGNVFPHRRFRRKPLVSDPGMHHGTCVTCRDACRDRLPAVAGKTFPAFPAHAHPQFCVSGKRPIAWESYHCRFDNNTVFSQRYVVFTVHFFEGRIHIDIQVTQTWSSCTYMCPRGACLVDRASRLVAWVFFTTEQ